jgi:urease accessory protein
VLAQRHNGAVITVTKRLPQGRGLSRVLLQRAATVELDWDVRCRSRFDATDSLDRALAVFLPRGQTVRGGDVLVAEDGSLIRVHAAAQPLLMVRPCATHGSMFDLMRAAYHLGNRHVLLELQHDRLLLEADHVLAEMLRRMHLDVSTVHAPFEPEAGAYSGGAHAHPHGAGAAHAGHHHGADHGDGHGH